MKTLKDFTPEIKAKIPEYIKKYTKGIYDGGRYRNFNQADAEALIHWNYEQCKLKNPVVLIAENIYESQIYFNYIKANQKIFGPILYVIYCLKNRIEVKGLSDKKQLDSQLYSQLYSQLRSQLRSQLDSQLDSQLGSQLYSQLDSQLYSQLRSQLDSQLRSQLDSQLGSQLKTYNNSYLFTSNVYSNVHAAWFKFIKDEFKIESEIGITLDSWNNFYQKSNVYSAIFSELVSVVSKYPKKIHVDSLQRLHNPFGSSIVWGHSTSETNMESYFIHGRNVVKELFDRCGKLTQSQFLNEKNEESRSAMYEILGEQKIMSLLEAKEVSIATFIHANGESEFMQLYKTAKPLNKTKNKPYAWLKRVCPSTGTTYLTPTDPDFTTVEQAAKFHRPSFVPNSIDYKWISRS